MSFEVISFHVSNTIAIRCDCGHVQEAAWTEEGKYLCEECGVEGEVN